MENIKMNLENIPVMVKDEKSLIVECRDIYERKIKSQSEDIIFGFWEIGSRFIQYEAEGWIERKHGEATVTKVAENLGIYYTQLYAAKAFAGKYPTEQDVRELLFSMKEKGISATWTSIRTKVLPKNAGLKKEERQQQLMGEGEKAAAKVEQIITELTQEINRGEASDSQVEEMISVKETLQKTMIEADKALQAFPKPQRESDGDYISWIKKQPEWACIATGDTEADPHHVQTVGSGGSDIFIVPLSREEHTKAHHGDYWTGYKLINLCKWFYSKHEIDRRWIKEGNGQ
jgi:hypothetical protein